MIMTRYPGRLTPNLTFSVLGHSTIALFFSSFFPVTTHPTPHTRAQVTARVGELVKGLSMEVTPQCFICSRTVVSAGLY